MVEGNVTHGLLKQSTRIPVVSGAMLVFVAACFSSKHTESESADSSSDAIRDSDAGDVSRNKSDAGVKDQNGGNRNAVNSSGSAGSVLGGNGGVTPSHSTIAGQIVPFVDDRDDPCPGSIKLDLDRIPIDIIIAVETKSGMSETLSQLQEFLFPVLFEQLSDADIDPRIIVIAAQAGNASSKGTICIEAPWGSGNCEDDSNPPHYFHIDKTVGENDALSHLADYSIYKSYLRAGVSKVMLVISNGDATFDSANRLVETIDGRPDLFVDWVFYSIHCFTDCESADAVGLVYDSLVSRTNGMAFDLCRQDLALSFEELATDILNRDFEECIWSIPPLPDGDYPNPNLINVLVIDTDGEESVIGMFPAEPDCTLQVDGWFYRSRQDPMTIALCPNT